ncbi:MAG: hypothetical protein IJX39_00210 [Clostridia bacterium]|nr:hypothetical protein [Clostridia bacterium]
MTVEQMRAELSKVYTGEGWRKKVAHMHDNQIIAIYRKFLEENRLKGR